MVTDRLDYASGAAAKPAPPGWLLVLRRHARQLLILRRRYPVRAAQVQVVALLAAAALVISCWFPWVWYGSRTAYQRHRMLTFTMPPDKVVYEEDPVRLARLLAEPRDPATAYVGDRADPPFVVRPDGDYDSDQLRDCAAYVPRFHDWTFGFSGAPGLAFVHERVAPAGGSRMVLVTTGGRYPRPGTGGDEWLLNGQVVTRRDGLLISARSGPVTGTYDREIQQWPAYTILIPLSRARRARVYAGQIDSDDGSRLTIRYEINSVAGMIEGKLQADGSVVLRVVDGPAAGTWQPVVAGPLAGQWRPLKQARDQ
jgi:hypothetical protein